LWNLLTQPQTWSSPANRALRQAVRRGNVNNVGVLLERGGDPNMRYKLDLPLLCLAAHRGYTEVARCLLEAGADVDKRNRATLQTPLMQATAKGHVEVVRLLLDFGADVNAASLSGGTALTQAALYGHEAVAHLLIERGANIHARTRTGQTALAIAQYKGYEEVAELLRKAGA
jgi:ankyrin repeat protein